MAKRTPQQIAEDLQAQLARVQTQAALESAKNDEGLVDVVNTLQGIKDQLTEARKGFNSGPQSYDNRIASHEAWVAEIRAQQDANKAMIEVLTEERVRVEQGLNGLALGKVNGEDPTQEEIDALTEVDISEVNALFYAAEDAKMVRQSLISNKRQKKSNTNQENS